jgi:hypothetical protein
MTTVAYNIAASSDKVLVQGNDLISLISVLTQTVMPITQMVARLCWSREKQISDADDPFCRSELFI